MEKCEKCGLSFKYQKNLNRHIKENRCNSKKHEIKCPLCKHEAVFSRHEYLRDHLIKEHNISLHCEEKCFQSWTAFEDWKRQIEEQNICEYVRRDRNSLKNEQKRSLLLCHRSGYFTSESTGKKRLKRQGSNKIESMCPSVMVVTENATVSNPEEVLVTFWPVHVGHSINIGRCRWNDHDRRMIADKLKDGVSMETILDQISDNVQNIHAPETFVLKNDSRNIKRDFGIFGGREHPSDLSSLTLWIKKMALSGDENPILYYRSRSTPDDDFILIISTNYQREIVQRFGKNEVCIDSTHSTNPSDFHLTSLLVVDEFGNCFPGAYCVSNRKDTDTWKTFFSILKANVGTIDATTFITDDDPSYYSAWVNIMSPVGHNLLCTWHVDLSWRKQIDSQVGGSRETKALAYKALKVMQYEPSETKFETLMNGIMEEFRTNKATKKFGKYFETYYANRTDMWAYCHQAGCGIITITCLENLHKCLEYFYLVAKQNKRLDRCLNALLKFTRDKRFDRLIKINKSKRPAEEDCIVNSHVESKEINLEDICKISNNIWEVPSSSSKDIRYEVEKIEGKCTDNIEGTCEFYCIQCDICIHMFNCECADFTINSNVCKHIHAVNRSMSPIDSLQAYDYEVSLEPEENEVLLIADCVINQEKNEMHEKLKMKIKTLIGMFETTTYSTEDELTLEKLLDEALLVANSGKRKLMSNLANKGPSNKKTDLQPRT